MKEQSFGISIVVPTRGREHLLARLLGSFNLPQGSSEHLTEILIVDDTPLPERHLIEQVCRDYQAIYIAGTNSVREKRNLGIERAIHPIVLFVDSDCEATPGLIEEHVKVYQENDPSIAAVVGLTEFVGEDSGMWAVIERTQFLNAFSFAQRMEFAPWATCSNTSYRKGILVELGGFDTNLPFRLGGDDLDLGLRLNKAGYKMKCNPNAVVLHTRTTWTNFVAMARRSFRWGRMDLHIYYRKHREKVVFDIPKFGHVFLALALVGTMEAFIFSSIWTLALPVIWASLVLMIQAASTVFIRGEQWRYLPAELLADILGLVFECGLITEGIRYRELEVLYKTVQRGPVLPAFENQEAIVQTWSMSIGLIIVMFFQGVMFS